eukprot:TRINITY_DN51815_c0_g1_i1.p1 TRINITY_DN51815_c0_g1~~TRINITY_DN51815_c0_g1_i1.p1  ORF type:complete len:361 (-),score=54.12 TRINITY_DN51815_c0_g1_i1:88-1101(-)
MTALEALLGVKKLTGDLGRVVMMSRMFRILRLLRLVKAIPPLYMLSKGIMNSMQHMFWVLVLTLVTLYTVAIWTTKFIGHMDVSDGAGISDEVAEATVYFKSVFDSIFTLFAIMNGSGWDDIDPLLNEFPTFRVPFVMFSIFSGWCLLSVLTGIVNDCMMSANEERDFPDACLPNGESCVGRIEHVLRCLFVAGDAHDSGCLSRERYDELLDNPHYSRMVSDIAPNASMADVRNMFTLLDVTNSGQVTFQDMVEGFRILVEPVTGRALLLMDTAVKTHIEALHQSLKCLHGDLRCIERRAGERKAVLGALAAGKDVDVVEDGEVTPNIAIDANERGR